MIVQKDIFFIFNEIQKNREDQIKMNDQLEEIRRKYQRAQNSLDKIVY